MARDLKKAIKAQHSVEDKIKSKFTPMRDSQASKSPRDSMVRLTATIRKENLEYLNQQTLERSQSRGKILNLSTVLREILKEHSSLQSKG